MKRIVGLVLAFVLVFGGYGSAGLADVAVAADSRDFAVVAGGQDASGAGAGRYVAREFSSKGASRALGTDYTITISCKIDYAKAFAVLRLVNGERAKAGLGALRMSADLLETAKLRSAEITVYFSHTRPSGERPWSAGPGDGPSLMGENIAYGYGSAAAVMDGWMNSPGHRANILNSGFTEVGIGCALASDGRLYWVQFFGDRTATAAAGGAGSADEKFSFAADSDYVARITFDSRGGSSVAPKYVGRDPAGSKVSYGSLPTPKRARYGFLGWYTAAKGGAVVGPSTRLDGNATVYAHWELNAPGANKISKVTKGKRSFTVKWTKAKGAEKYQLGYRLKGAKKWKLRTYSGSKRKAVVKGLKSKRSYQVRVRAYRTAGGDKVYAKWSKAKTVKTK